MQNPSLIEQKKSLRQTMLVQRIIAHAQNPQASTQLCDVFLASITLPPASLISLYMAQKNEMDPAPLTAALMKQGHKFCLPVVSSKGTPLTFRAWQPGDLLVPGVWNILEPPMTATTVTPTILLVPLLAFDRHGYRLGYGGGYYDRTLNKLRTGTNIQAIGTCYSVQEVPAVPTGPNDARLNAIVTEQQAFQI